MTPPIDRRHFLGVAAATLAASPARSAESPSNKVVVGVMGTGGRGTGLAKEFCQQPGVEVAFVADADLNRANKAAGEVEKLAGKAPKVVQDFRKFLDDKSVDVMVCAAPNHWHAPATILACAAGKHVYVEKPCSHNPREGELMVAAARKFKRQVQMGNQRRSYPGVIQAMQALKEGVIGRPYLAQSWYLNTRGETGKGVAKDAPEGLDYDLWQGPAPRKPFRSNYLHYTWHWFWHWGNGELGNNGIHTIDLCRWGLGVDYPTRVVSSGGRYHFDDDQETPDTQQVSYEFDGRRSIVWQGFSCNATHVKPPHLIMFVGDKGSLGVSDTSYVLYDLKGKELKKETVPFKGFIHAETFLKGVRGEGALTSEIEEGHKSTLLCHLGNISQRTGRALNCDPKTGHILGDKEAMALWGRQYEAGWEPKV